MHEMAVQAQMARIRDGRCFIWAVRTPDWPYVLSINCLGRLGLNCNLQRSTVALS